jgi:hypothetical protein
MHPNMRHSFEHRRPSSGTDHHSRRESNRSYGAGTVSGSSTGTSSNYKNDNNDIPVSGKNTYAQPYYHRNSYLSEQSNNTKSSKPTASNMSLERTTTPTIAVFGIGSKTSTHFIRYALDAGYHVRAMIIHQSLSSSKNSIELNHPLYTHDEHVQTLAKEIRDEFSAQEEQSILHWIRADCIYDIYAIRRTIRDVQYVVCMMQDIAPISSYTHYIDPTITDTKQLQLHRKFCSKTIAMDPSYQSVCTDHTKPITSFLKVLYPLMKEEMSIKVFLYQVRIFFLSGEGFL